MRYAHRRDSAAPLCASVDERLVRLDGAVTGISTVDDLVRAGSEVQHEVCAAALERADDDAWVLPAGEPLDAPLLRPGKVVCIGLNYRDHADEVGLDLPTQPLVFAKFPSALCGPGAPLRWPAGTTDQVDWEGELAVVVGHRLGPGARGAAMDAVFGFTVANDVSARDLQFGDVQWTRGKSLDGFCPLGPVVVSSEEVDDPQDLDITTRLNGEVVQQSNTRQMIFTLRELLGFVASFCTLEPGDLVLTGTPAGVGGFRSPPLFMAAGDHIEVEVEGLGVLANPVAGPEARG